MTLAALYFIAILGLALLKRSQLQSPSLFLFRAFFPSWRFFEDLGEVPTLSYRASPENPEKEAWKELASPVRRKWRMLFFNPEGNTKLAYGSLLQLLFSDLEEADEAHPESLESRTSYQLVKNLVQNQIGDSTLRYQFKLSSAHAGEGPQSDLLISPVYEAER